MTNISDFSATQKGGAVFFLLTKFGNICINTINNSIEVLYVSRHIWEFTRTFFMKRPKNIKRIHMVYRQPSDEGDVEQFLGAFAIKAEAEAFVGRHSCAQRKIMRVVPTTVTKYGIYAMTSPTSEPILVTGWEYDAPKLVPVHVVIDTTMTDREIFVNAFASKEAANTLAEGLKAGGNFCRVLKQTWIKVGPLGFNPSFIDTPGFHVVGWENDL